MDRNTVVRKIVSGDYDTQTSNFVRAYDDMFQWMISNNRNITLTVNIYSFNFMLKYDDTVKTLEPYFDNNMFILHINNNVSPRYGMNVIKWVRDLHTCSNEVSKYLIEDVAGIIMGYVI
jgi:hypothetical protein